MSAVSLTITNAIAELHLDNPSKLNALTTQMLDNLSSHLDEIERNPTVRVVLLTAAPCKAFCAGADIIAWGQLSPAEFARHWVRHGHRIFDRLARLSKPTIAVINAHAFGGGLELAACCDICIMAPRATLALPEAKVGIVPGWSGTQRLTRLIGEPAVKEMALFGQRIVANRAVTLGFACEVADDPHARALELAHDACTLSPRATEIAKNMIHAGAGEDHAALIEALGSAAISATDDRQEGVGAFEQKRAAKFSGA